MRYEISDIMKEQLSYEHLFHFGLQVSVLPEGHLKRNIMKILMMMMIMIMMMTMMMMLILMMMILMMKALGLGAICTGGLGLHSSRAYLKDFHQKIFT